MNFIFNLFLLALFSAKRTDPILPLSTSHSAKFDFEIVFRESPSAPCFLSSPAQTHFPRSCATTVRQQLQDPSMLGSCNLLPGLLVLKFCNSCFQILFHRHCILPIPVDALINAAFGEFRDKVIPIQPTNDSIEPPLSSFGKFLPELECFYFNVSF